MMFPARNTHMWTASCVKLISVWWRTACTFTMSYHCSIIIILYITYDSVRESEALLSRDPDVVVVFYVQVRTEFKNIFFFIRVAEKNYIVTLFASQM